METSNYKRRRVSGRGGLKALILALALCSIFEHDSWGQLASGTVRKPIYTDAGGTNVSQPLVFTNQFKLTVAPTDSSHVARLTEILTTSQRVEQVAGLIPMTVSTNGVVVGTATNVNLIGLTVSISGKTATVTASTSAGTVDSIISTNFTSASTSTAFTWQNIASLTTTTTNGLVTVRGRASSPSSSAPYAFWVRVRNSGTTLVRQGNNLHNGSGNAGQHAEATLDDTLTGTARTYYLDVSDSSGSLTLTNAYSASGASPPIVDGMGLEIIQKPVGP